MNWTENTPTVSGWYWLFGRLVRSRSVTMVYVDVATGTVYHRTGSGVSLSFVVRVGQGAAEWFGPLKPPKREKSQGKPGA